MSATSMGRIESVGLLAQNSEPRSRLSGSGSTSSACNQTTKLPLPVSGMAIVHPLCLMYARQHPSTAYYCNNLLDNQASILVV